MRKRKILLIGLGVLVLAGAATYATSPLYWSRYFKALTVNPLEPPLDWYKPMATVKGAPDAGLLTATPEQAGVSATALDAAAAYAGTRGTDALIVARDGKVVYARYWNGVGPQSRMKAHSFTKTMTGLTVGAAIADGKIKSAEQPAADFLPEWRNDERRTIKIRDLLQMSSGLEPPDFAYAPWSKTIRTFLTPDLAKTDLALKLADKPGTVWGHHNPDPAILALIVERATGMPFADYLSEKLFQPLGMHDGALWLDKPGGLPHGDCCMVSQVEDWMRVGIMLADGGAFEGRQVLPASYVTAMGAPSPANAGYGYQIWRARPFVADRIYSPVRPDKGSQAKEPIAAEDAIFFDGWGKRRLWIIPSQKLVILRDGVDVEDWDDTLIPNLILRGLATPAAPPRQTNPEIVR
jgi:CubicO group peptidase (beta-lactamase class C family)